MHLTCTTATWQRSSTLKRHARAFLLDGICLQYSGHVSGSLKVCFKAVLGAQGLVHHRLPSTTSARSLAKNVCQTQCSDSTSWLRTQHGLFVASLAVRVIRETGLAVHCFTRENSLLLPELGYKMWFMKAWHGGGPHQRAP